MINNEGIHNQFQFVRPLTPKAPNFHQKALKSRVSPISHFHTLLESIGCCFTFGYPTYNYTNHIIYPSNGQISPTLTLPSLFTRLSKQTMVITSLKPCYLHIQLLGNILHVILYPLHENESHIIHGMTIILKFIKIVKEKVTKFWDSQK